MVIEYLTMGKATVQIPTDKCTCFKQNSTEYHNKTFDVNVHDNNGLFSIEVDSSALDLKEILQTDISNIDKSKYNVLENTRYSFKGNKLYPNLVMLNTLNLEIFWYSFNHDYRREINIEDAKYSNLGNTPESDLILDLIDDSNDTPVIINDQIQMLQKNPEPYNQTTARHSDVCWQVTPYRALKTANTTTYLHATNLNEYYTIIRGNNTTKQIVDNCTLINQGEISTQNLHQFNRLSLLSLDNTKLNSTFTFKEDFAHLGYEGRLVFKTDDYLYFIDLQLVDENISDDNKASNQFMKLWTIDKNKAASDSDVVTTADVLDADSKNGNNKFNTDVRDSNWDTSVQGQECSPTISDYDSDLKAGIMYLGYHDANSDDTHRVLNYFKKYTIDTDTNTLAITDLTVDWNNFDQGWSIPDLFYSEERSCTILTNISQTHLFSKNNIKYLVCVDIVQFALGNSNKLTAKSFNKNYFRFRFFKFVDQNNLKLLTEQIFDNSESTCDKTIFAALYKQSDDMMLIFNQCKPITEITFNTETESIDVKTIQYFESNSYVEENKTEVVQIYTPYYTLIQPEFKSDNYIIDSLYPANYNLFKKLSIEIIYPQNTVDPSVTNSFTILIKVKDNRLHQYVSANVNLKLTEAGEFTLTHTKNISITVPKSGANIGININSNEGSLVSIISQLAN